MRFYSVLAAVASIAALSAAAERGPLQSLQPDMSTTSAPYSVIESSIAKNGKTRPEVAVDRRGVRYVIAYDERGRVYAITLPDKQIAVFFQFGADERAASASMLDLQTGKEIVAAHAGRLRHKLLTSQDDIDGMMDLVNTIDDPFSGDFNAFGGTPIPPNPEAPNPNCPPGLENCNTVCDLGSTLAATACAAAGGPAGAVLCGVIIVGAWAQCRNRCTVNCR